MYPKADALLQKWREDVKFLERQIADLSGDPPAVHHTSQDGPANATTVAVLQGQLDELKRLIKERQERLAR